MALKDVVSRTQVCKHLIIKGVPDEVNKAMNVYLADGWRIATSQFMALDKVDGFITVGHVLVKDVETKNE